MTAEPAPERTLPDDTTPERYRQELQRLQGENADLERSLDRTINERDEREELLDQFARAIASVEVIGEHSSANDPWVNALELLRERRLS